MSWYREFVADSKAAALAEITRHADGEHPTGGGIPRGVADLIKEAIEAQPDNEAIKVKTNGHLGGTGGQSAAFEVGAIPIVKAE